GAADDGLDDRLPLARRAQPDGAVVEVGMAGVEQALDLALVLLAALGLRERPLVPVEAEPAQRVEDLLDVLGRRALAVGVLDPQDEGAVRAPGEQPVVQCRPRAADVQGPGGRRREANPWMCDRMSCHALKTRVGGMPLGGER